MFPIYINFVFNCSDLNKSGQSENDPFLEGDKADSNVTTENTTNTKANSNGQ